MTTPGYLAQLLVGGAPVAFTGAATTDLGDDTFQITNATRRVLALDVPVEVFDGATELPPDAYSVDYLFGIVSLVAPPTDTVTVSGSYLPLLAVAEVRSFTVNMTATELDTSVLGEAHTTFKLGKRGAEVSLETLSLVTADLDPGAAAQTWDEYFVGGGTVLVDALLAGTARWRGWVRIPALQEACPSDGLYTGSITAKTVPMRVAGRREIAAFRLRREG